MGDFDRSTSFRETVEQASIGLDEDQPYAMRSRSMDPFRGKAVSSHARLSMRTGEGNVSEFPDRQNLHLMRKIFHFLCGFSFAFVYSRILSPEGFKMVMWTLTVTSLTVELLRLSNGPLNEAFMVFSGPFLRQHEVSKLSGTPYYLLGLSLSATLYQKPVAMLSFLCLAILDPCAAAAAYFTRSVEWAKLPNGKSIIGFAVAAVMSTGCVYVFVKDWPVGPLFAVKIGIISATAELLVPSPQLTLPLPWLPLGVDDNLIIPIITGFTITEVVKSMGLQPDSLKALTFL